MDNNIVAARQEFIIRLEVTGYAVVRREQIKFTLRRYRPEAFVTDNKLGAALTDTITAMGPLFLSGSPSELLGEYSRAVWKTNRGYCRVRMIWRNINENGDVCEELPGTHYPDGVITRVVPAAAAAAPVQAELTAANRGAFLIA